MTLAYVGSVDIGGERKSGDFCEPTRAGRFASSAFVRWAAAADHSTGVTASGPTLASTPLWTSNQ